jgi:hypothetical protein
MIKNSLIAFGHAARDLFRRRGALALLSALYFLALLSTYYFFATGVANTSQLVLTVATAVTAPFVFCLLLAAVAHHARGARGAGELARRALRDCWKVLLVALPLIALGVGAYYLLVWIEGRLPKPSPLVTSPGVLGPRGMPPTPPPHWTEVLMSAARLFVYGLALPLAAAQLWLSIAGEGLKATLRRFHRVLGAAYAPRSVLVYVVGAVFFAVMPYFVIFTRTPLKNGWLELLIFGLRLALAFVLTLWGWTITLGALSAAAPRATGEKADGEETNGEGVPATESSAAGTARPEAAGA